MNWREKNELVLQSIGILRKSHFRRSHLDRIHSHLRFVEDNGGSTSSRGRGEGRGANDGKSSESDGELHFDILI